MTTKVSKKISEKVGMWETWVLSMYRPGYNINLIDGETSGSEPANSASSPPPHAHSIPTTY